MLDRIKRRPWRDFQDGSGRDVAISKVDERAISTEPLPRAQLHIGEMIDMEHLVDGNAFAALPLFVKGRQVLKIGYPIIWIRGRRAGIRCHENALPYLLVSSPRLFLAAVTAALR
jgi:hypothetical protein